MPASRVSQHWWLGLIWIIRGCLRVCALCQSWSTCWFKRAWGTPILWTWVLSTLYFFCRHTLKLLLCGFNNCDSSTRAINWRFEDERSLGKRTFKYHFFQFNWTAVHYFQNKSAISPPTQLQIKSNTNNLNQMFHPESGNNSEGRLCNATSGHTCITWEYCVLHQQLLVIKRGRWVARLL